MNERIRQLALQAKQYAEDKQNDPLKIYTLDCFNEKFAELIVKDIHAYVDGMDTAQVISNGILRRYGVEE